MDKFWLMKIVGHMLPKIVLFLGEKFPSRWRVTSVGFSTLETLQSHKCVAHHNRDTFGTHCHWDGFAATNLLLLGYVAVINTSSSIFITNSWWYQNCWSGQCKSSYFLSFAASVHVPRCGYPVGCSHPINDRSLIKLMGYSPTPSCMVGNDQPSCSRESLPPVLVLRLPAACQRGSTRWATRGRAPHLMIALAAKEASSSHTDPDLLVMNVSLMKIPDPAESVSGEKNPAAYTAARAMQHQITTEESKFVVPRHARFGGTASTLSSWSWQVPAWNTFPVTN